MGKVRIYAPNIDPVTIDNVKSFKAVVSGTAFYSGEDISGTCLGVAPPTAVLEMITDE